jgi:hypothetical protein
MWVNMQRLLFIPVVSSSPSPFIQTYCQNCLLLLILFLQSKGAIHKHQGERICVCYEHANGANVGHGEVEFGEDREQSETSDFRLS